MRVAWAFALLVLSACSTSATRPVPAPGVSGNPLVPCTEPRPQLCTMQYAPACASLADGGFRTYASACNACADQAVAGYHDGPCSE